MCDAIHIFVYIYEFPVIKIEMELLFISHTAYLGQGKPI